MSIFDPFWGSTWPNLAPTWRQLGTQNPSKIDQKLMKIRIQNMMRIFIDF